MIKTRDSLQICIFDLCQKFIYLCTSIVCLLSLKLFLNFLKANTCKCLKTDEIFDRYFVHLSWKDMLIKVFNEFQILTLFV
jgi:hypothetical protein